MENRIYSKILMWLFIGLMLSFLCGYCLSLNTVLLSQILSIGIIPIIVIELIVAVLMGFRIKQMSVITAKTCYLLYSALTGITFGTIFLAYSLSSIILVFLITAVLLGGLGAYGYFTQTDIFRFKNILLFSLLGIIIISIVNIFIGSSSLELLLSVLSIIVFMGYIAFDVNNIKYLVNSMDEDKAAIYGAFQLYLDFINIFIELLRIFGKDKD